MKTDRRDAEELARLLRSGELTAIDLPDVEREALRDLARARFDTVLARHVARQQFSSFLLRHDRRWDMQSAWTKKHFEWIRRRHFDIEAQLQVLEDDIAEVLHTDLRVERLTQPLAIAAQAPAFAPMMRSLQRPSDRTPAMRYPTRASQTESTAKRSASAVVVAPSSTDCSALASITRVRREQKAVEARLG